MGIWTRAVACKYVDGRANPRRAASPRFRSQFEADVAARMAAKG